MIENKINDSSLLISPIDSQIEIEHTNEIKEHKNNHKKQVSNNLLKGENPNYDNKIERKIEEKHSEQKKMNYLERIPIRLKYMKESLKQYHLIKKNKYLDRKKRTVNDEDFDVCNCIPCSSSSVMEDPKNKFISYNCGPRCLNRLVCTECDPTTCPSGNLCQNRRFQNHEYAKIYPFPTGGKGWGLSAGEKVYKNQFIMQYIGEIYCINSDIGRKRLKEYSHSTCTYLMKTSNNEVIDPTYKGNMARFINHSCDPNCITEKWHVSGETCVGIFALKDIEEDQELNFDYKFDSFRTPLTKCLCGTANCKGYLGVIPTNYTIEEWEEQLDNLPCSICDQNIKDDDDKLLLCDDCNRGFHIFCLVPPLNDIPKEAWFCDECKSHTLEDKTDDNEEESLRLKKYKEMKMSIVESETKKRREHFKNTEYEEDQSDFEEEGISSTILHGNTNTVIAEKNKEKNTRSEEYEEFYKLQKKLEREALRELFGLGGDDEQELEGMRIKRKKEKAQRIKQKPNENYDRESPPNDKPEENDKNKNKKEEVSHIKKIADDQFKENLFKNQILLSKITLFETKREDESLQDSTLKKIIMINNLELYLFKQNFVLFEKISAKIFWDHRNSKGSGDPFEKKIEFSVIGSQIQIDLVEQMFIFITQTVNQVKKEIGIVEAEIMVPSLFLKKLIGNNHQNLHNLERNHSVHIVYDKRFLTDECYPLTLMMRLNVKGKAENIKAVHQDIKKFIQNLEAKRIFLNQSDIRIVLLNLATLKKLSVSAEFRINRDQPFKEINHPFYFIHYKDKELVIIGTKEEINQTEKTIFDLIKSERIKDGGTILTYNYLLPNWMRQNLIKIKQEVESEVKGCKIMIYDPTHPRKNITLSITGISSVIDETRESIINKLQNLEGSELKFDKFQEQMLLQITKYLFKYLQNSFLAEDVIFMKNWDISTAEFKSSEFISSFYEQFPRDSELILYISYVCQLKLHDIESKFKLSGPEEIITIMKSLLYKALNNNINLTKIYKPLWEKSKLEHFFKQLELKNIHSTELIKTLLEIKQNPRSFLQNPDAFYHKMNYKHQYNTPPHNSPIHPKSPVNKLSKNYSENPNSNNSNIYDLNYINDEKNHRRTLSRSRSRSRSRLFRSMKLYGISENFKEEQQEYNSVFVIRDDYPPVESFINTEDFFISALNDNKNFEKFNLLNNSSINNGKGIRIKEQIDEDNKVLEEKKVQIINQYNNINHNIIQPKRKSNEKQQPSHKSVLLRINNEHKTEHSPSKKRSDSSSESKIKSSISESSSKSHRKRKKTPSNDSKSKNKRKISKKQQNNNNNNSSSNNNSNIYYSSFSKKKNPREDYEKYLTGGDSTKGIGGGHYERQLLKKYKGEKLAEFIEKASGSKISKEFGNYEKKKKPSQKPIRKREKHKKKRSISVSLSSSSSSSSFNSSESSSSSSESESHNSSSRNSYSKKKLMKKEEKTDKKNLNEEIHEENKTNNHENSDKSKKKKEKKSKSKENNLRKNIKKNDFRSYLTYKEKFLKKFKNTHGFSKKNDKKIEDKNKGNEGEDNFIKEKTQKGCKESETIEVESNEKRIKKNKLNDVSEGEI